MEHLGHLHAYLFSPSSTNLRAVLVRRGAHSLPPHRYAMTLKRRSPGDMQAPNAVPEADWSRRSTSSWLSRAPPLLVWTAGSARTQWTRGPPHSLAHRGRRCLRSHASAGIQIGCMRYCAYCATPPTSDSQYQCARSGIDYILHWSARIRGAVRRLRRTALGDTASVLVFIVLVFKQEASVRVHAVLPLHTVLPGPEPGWLCDQPGRDQSWRPSPALLCQAPARRGAVASGTAAPPAATRRSSIAVPAT